MNSQTQLALILLPLLVLGIAQIVYAIGKRAKLPPRFTVMFIASGIVTIIFSVALWVTGSRLLS